MSPWWVVGWMEATKKVDVFSPVVGDLAWSLILLSALPLNKSASPSLTVYD